MDRVSFSRNPGKFIKIIILEPAWNWAHVGPARRLSDQGSRSLLKDDIRHVNPGTPVAGSQAVAGVQAPRDATMAQRLREMPALA
jgi:hypothetical protein